MLDTDGKTHIAEYIKKALGMKPILWLDMSWSMSGMIVLIQHMYIGSKRADHVRSIFYLII